MRKMADKLGQITSPKPPASPAGTTRSQSPASPSAPQPSGTHQQQQSQMHSPAPSLSSTQSTALSSAGHRPSISTERTSVSEWKTNSPKDPKRSPSEHMDVDMPAESAVPLQTRRPTGSYRLSDFIIHRTLGTGSFGRVHLGTSQSSSYLQWLMFSVHGSA